MRNTYNSNYKIALYKLPATYSEILKRSLYYSNDYSNNTFKITTIDSLAEIKGDLTSKPDVLLIDTEEVITKEMETYLKKNLIQLVRVTTNKIKSTSAGNMFLSFGSHPKIRNLYINDSIINCNNSNIETVTHFNYSVEVLKNLTQMANTFKLQYVSKKILTSLNEKKFLDSLMCLNAFISLKDSYTKMHSDNVSNYSLMIGKELNLPQEQLELIEIGGKLHDIGKIGIPDSIIRKECVLSQQEFQIMKKHPVIGEVILSCVDCREIKEMVCYHHERMDGNGYPIGLKGDEIPFFARIISVADTFDAMTTKRTYNKQKTLEEAFEELRKSSEISINNNGDKCQQLDSNLVECFINAFSKDEKMINEFKKKDVEIIKSRNYKK